MHRKKWLSFILILALVVTSFVSIPIASYAYDGGMPFEFMRGVTFTKADAAGTPASPLFIPGSGAPVILPDLGSAPESYIPGFYVTKNHYNCWAIVSGQTAEDAEVEFNIPESPVGASWILQMSTSGGVWSDCNGGATYSRADYNSSITTEPDWYSYTAASYRLNRVGTSIYTIEADVTAPTVLTEFTNLGSDPGMNSDLVGSTGTITTVGASFIGVNDTSDIPLQDENIIYTWYRVNPVTYEMTPISGESGTGAEYMQYTTTADDIGYKILCKIEGDGTTVGGYMQVMVLGTPISAPVKGYVSNASGNTFVLNLESDVALTKDDLSVETYDGEIPCAISAVTAVSGGSVYAVTMSDDPYSSFGTSQKFVISSEKSGVILGRPWTQPSADDLTPVYTAANPQVEVTSEPGGDQVYPSGSAFSCTVTVPESVASPGAVVRVAFGSLGASGKITPFVDSDGNPIDPFGDGILTLENSGVGKYYYKSATVGAGGTISFSGTVTSGVCPSALGIILANGESGYAISGLTVVSADEKQIMFGVENALPSGISSTPQFKDINNFYNIPEITFSAVMLDQPDDENDVTGSLAFSNLNLMEDWNEVMQLGSSMIFRPDYDGSTPAGFTLGMDHTKLVNLATNSAVISVTNVDVLQTLLNGGEAFTLDDFEIATTGTGVFSNAAYSNGTLSFDVNHFSTYNISFADLGGGGTPETPESSVEGLKLVYINNQNEQNRISVEGFSANEYSYTSTLHDDLSSGTIIGLAPELAIGSGATVSAVTFGALDTDLHAHSYVEVTEQDGLTKHVYTVEIFGDASNLYIDDCSGNSFVVGYPDAKGLVMALSATGQDGTSCDPLSLGTLTVDFVAGGQHTRLTPQSIYSYDGANDELTVNKEYLSGLPVGEYSIDVIFTDSQTSDEYSVTQSIYVVPATARVFFSDPANGAITVYKHTSPPDSEGVRGESVSSGGAVSVGGIYDVEINFTGDTGWRISSATITENYFGESVPNDVTDYIIGSNGTMFWQPYGDAYITIETQPVPSTLPVITGIQLYKFNESTGEFDIPVTSTTTGVSVDDILWAEVLFDTEVDESSNAYVDYLWQDMLRDSGTYSMDSTFECSPADQLDLLDVSEYVADNYVKLTVSNVPNYTAGGPVSIEFYVDSGLLDQTSPTGIQGVAPTTALNSDGKLSGTSTLMEYKLSGTSDSTYVTCSAPDTTVPGPGTYLVRYKATDTYRASAPVTVAVPSYIAPVVAVTGVTVNPTTLTLAVGAQETLTPQVAPQNADDQAVTWSTSNDSVATVDSSGVVNAVSVGHATVSAITSDGGFRADCSVTVVANAVSISGITANNKPYDGTTAASISGTPVLNGVRQGDSVSVAGTAIAAFADKNAGAGKDVFVSGYTLTGTDAAKYSLTSLSLKADISKLTLTAAAVSQTKGQNEPNPTPSITFTGFITGETAANSGITAPTASHTASQTSPLGSYDILVTGGSGGLNYNLITVKGTLTVVRSDIPLTGISLQKHSTELVTGTTETLAVDFTPTSASIKTLTWATSDAAIATVDNTGKVTALKAGTVTISAIAQDGGFTDSCIVTVMTPISLTSKLIYNDDSAISSAAGIYNVDGKKFPFYDANFLSETDKPLKLTLYGSGTEIKDQTQYTLVMSLDNNPSISQTLTTSGAALKSGVPVPVRRVSQMTDGSHFFTIVVKDGTVTKSAITINLAISGSIVPVTGISLSQSQMDLTAGDTKMLKATVAPSNASDKNVLWSTSNSAIATVSGGAVTAVGAGSTSISAVTNHRGYVTSATVNVGAKITGKLLKDGAAQPYSYLYLYQGSNFVGYASSDVNGNYTFKNVKVGSYSIKAFSPGSGYGDVTTDVAISVGDATKTVGDLNYVSVYSNKSTLTVNIQDQSGNPYSGSSDVYIYLYNYETGYYVYRTATAAEKTAGAATLTDVPYATAGTNYELSISTNDYWDYRSVTFDSTAETETFQIPVRYTISGKLLRDSDFNGAGDTAVPFSYVYADAGSWNYYYAYTDAQGNYTITGLDPGSYTLKPNDTSKYSFTPSAVTITNANLTGQNIVVTKGADLTGHVYKGSTAAYKAYVMLMDNSNQYLAGCTAGSSGFILDGAVKAPGTYKLQLSYVMEKNGTYPMFVCPDVTFTVTADDIAAGRITQNLTYTDPTNASDIFRGDGNTVVTDISVVRDGSTANLIIKYKNNGNQAVTASFGAIVPTGVTANSSSFTVSNLAAGASGQQSILLTVGNVTDTYINIPVKVEITGQTYDFGSASLEMAGVTLSGPGAVKTNEAFRVYGEATANSTVVIKDAITGKFYASVKPNGRWYSSAITLASEGTANLIAEVTASGGGASAVSSVLSVSATAEQLAIENVKSDSAGMSELPVNKIIGARAFTAWVDSSLNGRDISIATLFDKNIVSAMTYHFSGNDYTATKDSDGYYAATLNNWSGGGLKTITATVNTTDGRTLTFIIAEVTVLIDPSGYVSDDETGDRLSGVTVTCETTNDGGATWSTWNAELYGQINPQTTDSEGNYGWMVPAGTYRVRAVKTGYDVYLTDHDFGDIVIPPVRTDVNFALGPDKPMTGITLNSDELSINVGATSQLSATAVPDDATNKARIEWRSADSSIATVSSNGLVTGKTAGNTTIAAFFTRSGLAEIKAECAVTVAAVTHSSDPGPSSPATPQGPDVNAFKKGNITTVKTTIEGTLSGTTATAPVTKETVAIMLDSAKQAENSGQKARMEFTVTAPSNATTVKLEIPKASFSQIVSDTNADVSVKAPLATLTFDDKAVQTVNNAGAGDISINIAKVDTAQLSNEAKELVGDRPVFDFAVKSGSTAVTNFNGGKVSVSIPYTLGAGEDPEAVVVYYIDSTGSPKAIKGAYNSGTGTIDFTTTHFSKYAVGYNKVAFTDVSANAWYGDAVTFLAARGITTGTSKGVFSPSAKLTRAQFLVMALRAYGIEADTDTTGNFSDAGNTYYTGYLAAAKRLGISNGDGKGHFLPNAQITRQDMFVLLYRTLDALGELPEAQNTSTVAQFKDAAKVSAYATDAMNALIQAKVVSGNNGSLDPKGLSNRAQMAQVLYNLLAK